MTVRKKWLCCWYDAAKSQRTPKFAGKYQKLEDTRKDHALELSESLVQPTH